MSEQNKDMQFSLAVLDLLLGAKVVEDGISLKDGTYIVKFDRPSGSKWFLNYSLAQEIIAELKGPQAIKQLNERLFFNYYSPMKDELSEGCINMMGYQIASIDPTIVNGINITVNLMPLYFSLKKILDEYHQDDDAQ